MRVFLNTALCKQKSKEIYSSMMNKKYTKKEDMINKLQSLKGKIKVKNIQNFSNFYDEMNSLEESGNFHCEDDPFSKFA